MFELYFISKFCCVQSMQSWQSFDNIWIRYRNFRWRKFRRRNFSRNNVRRTGISRNGFFAVGNSAQRNFCGTLKKLVDGNNHIYTIEERINRVWYWKYVVPSSGARATTKHGQIEVGIEVISEFNMPNKHPHASNPNKIFSLRQKQKLKSLAQ